MMVQLVTMPLLGNANHFNCANVCAEKGKGPPGAQNPSGTEDSKEVQHGESKCFGSFCAVLTHDYNRLVLPEPWTEPAVMGTRQNQSSDENKCGAESAESVLNVITDLDVLEVSGVDQEEGRMHVLARVKMTWEEPNLGFCACEGHNMKAKYKLNLNLDDFIWTPDLVIHDSKDYEATSGLRKLGALEISLTNHCATKVSKIFDFQVTLMCPMAMGYYPLDRNICQLKLGSGTHPARRLKFERGQPRSRHTFEDWTVRDLLFHSYPMCREMELVHQHGLRGVLAQFKTIGINIIMTRRSIAVVLEYLLISATLTFTAICSLTLHYWSSRATLVASLVLSSIFVITTANTSTPQGQGAFNLNLVQWYLVGNTAIIFTTFIWICCGHMFKSHEAGPASRLAAFFKKDMVFAICLALSMVAFNIAYWLRWWYVEGEDICHNELELSKKGMVKCVDPLLYYSVQRFWKLVAS